MRTRSNSSQADRSDSTTWSPGCSPSRTSMVFTDARPSRTRVPRRAVPFRVEPEDADRALLLPEHPSPHVDHVVEALQLDRPVHRQVRARTSRQPPLQRHVDRHRPVLHRRVDPHHTARDDPVPRVHRCHLPDLDVLRLRLRNPQLRFRHRGVPPPAPGSLPPSPAAPRPAEPAAARPSCPPGREEPRHRQRCLDARQAWPAAAAGRSPAPPRRFS